MKDLNNIVDKVVEYCIEIGFCKKKEDIQVSFLNKQSHKEIYYFLILREEDKDKTLVISDFNPLYRIIEVTIGDGYINFDSYIRENDNRRYLKLED